MREAADDAGVELVGPRNAFLIQGDDRIGIAILDITSGRFSLMELGSIESLNAEIERLQAEIEQSDASAGDSEQQWQARLDALSGERDLVQQALGAAQAAAQQVQDDLQQRLDGLVGNADIAYPEHLRAERQLPDHGFSCWQEGR